MPQNDVTFREFARSGMIRRKSNAAAGCDSDDHIDGRPWLIPELHLERQVVEKARVRVPAAPTGGGAARIIHRRTSIQAMISG